ncbi:hypothetical protein Pcar_3118 [Syntrophotalea carbinolica DSM 2380]|uniref:Uncharacterized protein n=1 Tax=Syntrophotalea carbinolica (strain DSM 2380 / NBRC 103641 / GraBd1) TaxID=338963 RepID=Q39ZV4_SYNC1|nr:hypothetical protein [Syntrophotalea carbinolica]ABA90353.1 hypothetical protein Pcar_3118 [Syntrophotalea carbinolica DSM 2380]
MSISTFDFPLGIHPWPSEKRRLRRFQEGYTFGLLENSSDSYRFTVMAGADKIDRLFHAFAAAMPDECFFILEYYADEDEPPNEENSEPLLYYSPYLPKQQILEALKPYFSRLVHDGFVGFGLANNQVGMELFYSEEKVMTCFTCNHIRVMDILGGCGLPYQSRQLFTSDLGHDHLSLLCYRPETLPADLATLKEQSLDYLHFCREITEILEMYPVEDDLSFFLSQKEQQTIEQCLLSHPEFCGLAEEDFGDLLLSWSDFVQECEAGFEGGLEDYHDGLRLRDLIQYVIEGVPALLARKLMDVVAEADRRLRHNLIDCRKRLDAPRNLPLRDDRFWYRGMVRKQGVVLRRDLIRQGWFQP